MATDTILVRGSVVDLEVKKKRFKGTVANHPQIDSLLIPNQ